MPALNWPIWRSCCALATPIFIGVIDAAGMVIQTWQVGDTITVRLPPELALWLERTSAQSGLPRGRIIREQLERAMAKQPQQAFLRLAGAIEGPVDLSTRKGFSQPAKERPKGKGRYR